jgi:kynurenine 3-monooxygenase
MAPIVVVGGGMVGPVMAIYLAKRFGAVDVLERRPPPDYRDMGARHSLTMILSARGWRTLRALNLERSVRDICLPLRGRTAHLNAGEIEFEPYSVRQENIWCVERDALHRLLSKAASETVGVRVFHNVSVRRVDPYSPYLVIEDSAGIRQVTCKHIVGCDGVRSVVRRSIRNQTVPDNVEQLTIGYKEFDLSPQAVSRSPLSTTSFHYWPRREIFFGAFPNLDGGFNGSLFMPLEGDGASFSATRNGDHARALFDDNFPDLTPIVPDFSEQFAAMPVRTISIVRSERLVWEDKIVLVGDSCHAMAPFMGQGMNCGLEDVRILDKCLAKANGWTRSALLEYERMRKPDADAITYISFQHYRNLVAAPPADTRTVKRQALAERIYRTYPQIFSSLYERCAFHGDTSYSRTLSWHRTTERILDLLLESGSESIASVSAENFAESLYRAIARLPEDLFQPELHGFASTLAVT